MPSDLEQLAALDKAATQGEWQADGYEIRLLDGSPWSGDEKNNVAFMASLVNAYRSGDLVPRADGDVVAWMYERNGEVVLLNERLRGNVLRSVTGWAETALATATALATVQADLARVTAERDGLREDAERWQAFISSERFYVMGSAGFDWENAKVREPRDESNWLHFTLNVWDRHPAGNDAQGTQGRAMLLSYVDYLRKALGAPDHD